MPKIEVDEEDFLRSQKLRATVERVMSDPDAAVLVEQAIKKIDPNAKTPRLDARKTVAEPVDALRKEITDFIAAQNKDREERDSQAKRDALQAKIDAGFTKLRQDGYNDEGIKKIEALMQEKGLLDPTDAAIIFERMHPPAAPVVPTGGAWNFVDSPKDGGDVYERALLDSKGNNDLIADRKALEVLAEIRGAGRR
jgi:hypothetical protein